MRAAGAVVILSPFYRRETETQISYVIRYRVSGAEPWVTHKEPFLSWGLPALSPRSFPWVRPWASLLLWQAWLGQCPRAVCRTSCEKVVCMWPEGLVFQCTHLWELPRAKASFWVDIAMPGTAGSTDLDPPSRLAWVDIWPEKCSLFHTCYLKSPWDLAKDVWPWGVISQFFYPHRIHLAQAQYY